MKHDKDFGGQLREWRQRRRMSQFDLAAEADLSTRHLSFVETGRASGTWNTHIGVCDSVYLRLVRDAWLSAGCVRWSFFAARVRLPSR